MKQTPKKPKNILTLVVDGKARDIRLPKGLRITEVSRSFVREVLEEVESHLNGLKGRMILSVLNTEKGLSANLYYKVLNGTVYWGVRPMGWRGKGYAAGGIFISGPERWEEYRAACLPEFRGRGLYRALLVTMRRELRRPLVSDTVLTAANAFVWDSLGTPSRRGGRFRINPPPSRRTIQLGIIHARIMLALEVP